MRYATASGRWVIGATVLGSGMAAIDATVVSIALPSIGRQFHTPLSGLQWIVTGYTLTLAAFLLVGGSLGDHYGRRKVFAIGVVWFTVASAACAVAPNSPFLIVMRALQGVGGALLTPGSLAIIEASFDPDDRGRAIGAWSGLGGVATAAGPLLGGYLIAAASWRWIFVINLPIGLAVLAISVRHVPESRQQSPSAIDLPGALGAVVALAGITYGLIQGPAGGWGRPDVLAMLVIGVLALGALVVIERRSASPMLPKAVFRVRQFTVTNLVTFIVYAALGGALFLLPVMLQVVNGYSPLEAGVSLLPLTAIMLVLSSRSGRLAAAIGPRLQMSVGPVVVGGGLALLARTTTDAWYPTGVLPAVVVFGLGLAITVAPLTATAMGSLPDELAGVASAVNNDVARIGGLIAVAVLPSLAGIPATEHLSATTLASGFRTAMYIAGACCALGGVIAAVGIRNPHAAVRRFHCALDGPPLRLCQPGDQGWEKEGAPSTVKPTSST